MKIENDYTEDAAILFEKNMAIGGYTYLVIFGMHINGGFICIPNHNIGCEASNLEYQIDYNKDKLVKCGLSEDAAQEIAAYIDSWLMDNAAIVEEKRKAAQDRLMQRLKN